MLDPGSFARRIGATGMVVLLFVFVAFGALAYWQVFRGDLATHDGNPRLLEAFVDPHRGRILDREGQPLAVSDADGSRTYPQGNVSHAVGYLSSRFGTQGAELAFNSWLSGERQPSFTAAVEAEFLRRPQAGLDVRLTIDLRVQRAAAQALGDRRGAVVALDPRNGEILAMVSVPGYDPAAIVQSGEQLVADERSPLLNRATQGLYPPGSTFKTITAASLFENDVVKTDTRVTCPGEIVIDGFPISCRNVAQGVGTYPFSSAYTFSVNAIFAQQGVKLGWDRLLATARDFGLDSALDFTLDTAPTQVAPPDAELTRTLLAETAFGQGKLLVTPLQMAVVAAVVANEGVLASPHLGLAAYDGKSRVAGLGGGGDRRVISGGVARTLRDLMVSVIAQGQANVNMPGMQVGGKTGTAESGTGTSHAWFIGFAPAEKPTVAVAVVVEGGGQGGVVAAPMAGATMLAALRR